MNSAVNEDHVIGGLYSISHSTGGSVVVHSVLKNSEGLYEIPDSHNLHFFDSGELFIYKGRHRLQVDDNLINIWHMIKFNLDVIVVAIYPHRMVDPHLEVTRIDS